MRHRNTKRKLGRKTGPRVSMLRNLVESVILYESIQTTKAKAKEARKIVEKLITIGKKGDLASRRQLMKYLYTDLSVKKILEVLAPKYKNRKGGYTRVTLLGTRKGDGAEIVKLELV
ncbi:MAG: 50S ribosomal protein L17 [uncultured bacterium]|nr:MAG: 50S ribosomal protein L17 [uncultured bacterium]HBD05585.1 50S ribosomal protein L17 [Candidatus Uhrbacteria bacterium]